jgi:MFS family permease
LAIALSTLVGGVVSLYFSKVNTRLGYVSIAVTTFALLGLGFSAIGLAGGYPLLLFGLALGGVGTGLLMPVVNTWISSGTPEAIKGRALGGVTTAIYLGQFLSPVVSQPVGGTLGFGTLYILAGGLALAVAVFVALFLSSAKTKTKLERPTAATTNTATSTATG